MNTEEIITLLPYQKPFLFVGLDYENTYQVAEFAEELAEVDNNRFGFKLNLDFFIN